MRHRDFIAVLQVAPNTGQIDPHRNAMPLQLLRRAYARQHQQLRRIKGAAAQDDFPPGLHLPDFAGARVRFRMRAIQMLALQVLDACRAAVLSKNDASGQGIEFNVQRAGMLRGGLQ